MNPVGSLFRAINKCDESAISNIVHANGSQILNASYPRPLRSVPVTRIAPLALALQPRRSQNGPRRECWQILLDLGADPTFHDGTPSPIIEAIAFKNAPFLQAAVHDPLAEHGGFWCMSNLELTTFAEKFGTLRANADKRFVPIKCVFEQGWAEGAIILLNKAAALPTFDPNLTWSDLNYFCSFADQRIATFQFPAGAALWSTPPPFPPQSLLYRAAFSAMHGAVTRLVVELGADPSARNGAGHTLLHAVVFGALSIGRDCPGRVLSLEESTAYGDTCDVLLDAGVNPLIRDAFGVLPMDSVFDQAVGPCTPLFVRSIRSNLRLRTIVLILTRATRASGSRFHLLSNDALDGVLRALHPGYKRACNIPEKQ
jgi:hypothetical protein